MNVLVAGELNPDLILSGMNSLPQPGREILAGDFSLQLGSSSAIFAAGLSRLGNRVVFAGKVGEDILGAFAMGELERSGVDVSRVIVDARLKTGITVSLSGDDRALVTYPGSIAELRAEELPDELLGQSHHLHVASYYLQQGLQPGLGRLFGRARQLELTTSLDPGCDPSGQWSRAVLDLLPLIDVFLLNEVELAALSGCSGVESGLRGMSTRATLVVAKLGPRGCAMLYEDQLLKVPALPVPAVDTTGAGDSFNAGFLHAWLQRMHPADCLRCGAICGGLSTRGLGGTASQPSWDEVAANWNEKPLMAAVR